MKVSTLVMPFVILASVATILDAAAHPAQQHDGGKPSTYPTDAPSHMPSATPTPSAYPTDAPSHVPSATPMASTMAPEPTGKPTPAPSTPGYSSHTPTPAPSHMGKPTPAPSHPTIHHCTNVSVEGDATYCIHGPICVGSDDEPEGHNCPKKGDVAVQDCVKGIQSYTEMDKCIAPKDAACRRIHTGAWGCVFTPETHETPSPCPVIPGWEKPTPAPTGHSTPTPCPEIPGWEKPTPAPTGHGTPSPSKHHTPAPSTPCPEIPGWEKPTPAPTGHGTPSPSKHHTPAPSTPCPEIPGWEKPTPAPTGHATPSPCPVIPGWEKPTPAPTGHATPSPCPVIPGWEKPTPAPTGHGHHDCHEVSVEADATYCIDGPVCSGDGDAPEGMNCPRKGDKAVKHCLHNLKSYTDMEHCVAPVDAECKRVSSGAWGCVWPLAVTPSPSVPKDGAKHTPAPSTPHYGVIEDAEEEMAGSGSRQNNPYANDGQQVKFASENDGEESNGSNFGLIGGACVAVGAAMAMAVVVVRKRSQSAASPEVLSDSVMTPA